MDGLLAARIVSMICLGLVTWIIGIKGYHNWGLECSTVRIQHIRGIYLFPIAQESIICS